MEASGMSEMATGYQSIPIRRKGVILLSNFDKKTHRKWDDEFLKIDLATF